MPSPKIIVREFDFSHYLKTLVDFSVGVVGVAMKGEINKVTLITTPEQLIKYFGYPSENHPAVTAAYQYLRIGKVLFFNRVASDTAAASTAVLKNSGDTASITLTAREKGTYYNLFSVTVNILGSRITIQIRNIDTKRIVETHYADSVVALVAKINEFSELFTATVGTGLPVIQTVNCTGGNDGANPAVYASYTTNIAGQNNDLVFTAKYAGAIGNGIKVQYVVPTEDHQLSHTIVDRKITFTLGYTETGGGSVTTTANDLIAYVISQADIRQLIKVPTLKANNDGTGLLTTMAEQTLTGGINGPDYIGVVNDDGSRTGLQAFRSAEHYDIWALCVPGITDEEVHAEMLSIAGAVRKDCVAVCDTPRTISVQNVVDFHNGEGVYIDRATMQSSYGVVYNTWVRWYNPYTKQIEYCPPSGAFMYGMAKLVENYEVFFALGGLEQGRISWAMGVEIDATEGERDFMYAMDTNSVNPIIDYPGYGVMFFGQKTLARTQSALDRLNVRYLGILIRRALRALVASILFKPNDMVTWREFIRIVEPLLANLQRRRGIMQMPDGSDGYRVICDETTTAPIDVDNNIMRAKIMIKPTKAVEILIIDVNFLRTGADFDEYIGDGSEWQQ